VGSAIQLQFQHETSLRMTAVMEQNKTKQNRSK
jgi:hypothetical protein